MYEITPVTPWRAFAKLFNFSDSTFHPVNITREENSQISEYVHELAIERQRELGVLINQTKDALSDSASMAMIKKALNLNHGHFLWNITKPEANPRVCTAVMYWRMLLFINAVSPASFIMKQPTDTAITTNEYLFLRLVSSLSYNERSELKEALSRHTDPICNDIQTNITVRKALSEEAYIEYWSKYNPDGSISSKNYWEFSDLYFSYLQPCLTERMHDFALQQNSNYADLIDINLRSFDFVLRPRIVISKINSISLRKIIHFSLLSGISLDSLLAISSAKHTQGRLYYYDRTTSTYWGLDDGERTWVELFQRLSHKMQVQHIVALSKNGFLENITN